MILLKHVSTEGETMNEFEKIKQIAAENNGFVETCDVVAEGIRKEKLRRFLELGQLEKVSRGVYVLSERLIDEYKILQMRCKSCVFSHTTSLYLLGLSDRAPSKYHITVPQGSNVTHLSKERSDLVFHYVKRSLFNLGLASVKSPFGNTLRSYDSERTICDLLIKKDEFDIQIVSTALRSYFRGTHDISKLSKYSRILGVEDLLHTYTEVLL
jgi:predicted transcriptional regulator of viral defense system